MASSSTAVAAVASAATAMATNKEADRPAFLRIRDVVKDFGGYRAVDHVSLDIAKGEIFALLGSSGCGKTTLLRMLAGFETPTSGQIILNGQDLAGLPCCQTTCTKLSIARWRHVRRRSFQSAPPVPSAFGYPTTNRRLWRALLTPTATRTTSSTAPVLHSWTRP